MTKLSSGSPSLCIPIARWLSKIGNEHCGTDFERFSYPSEDGHRHRSLRALDLADVPSAQSGARCQFFLRPPLLAAHSTDVQRHKVP